MKLEKAIEIKEINYKGGEVPNWADYREADKLSIEALKAIIHSRQLHGLSLFNPLAGETEE